MLPNRPRNLSDQDRGGDGDGGSGGGNSGSGPTGGPTAPVSATAGDGTNAANPDIDSAQILLRSILNNRQQQLQQQEQIYAALRSSNVNAATDNAVSSLAAASARLEAATSGGGSVDGGTGQPTGSNNNTANNAMQIMDLLRLAQGNTSSDATTTSIMPPTNTENSNIITQNLLGPLIARNDERRRIVQQLELQQLQAQQQEQQRQRQEALLALAGVTGGTDTGLLQSLLQQQQQQQRQAVGGIPLPFSSLTASSSPISSAQSLQNRIDLLSRLGIDPSAIQASTAPSANQPIAGWQGLLPSLSNTGSTAGSNPASAGMGIPSQLTNPTATNATNTRSLEQLIAEQELLNRLRQTNTTTASALGGSLLQQLQQRPQLLQPQMPHAVASQSIPSNIAPIDQLPSLSGPKKPRSGTFPTKLHAVLLQLEKEEGGIAIASFLPGGRIFVVRKPKEFEQKIMPKYFRMSHFSSFQRQLNLYSFHRITDGPTKGGYYHPLFVRDNPSLASQIKRMKTKVDNTASASDDKMPSVASNASPTDQQQHPTAMSTTAPFLPSREMTAFDVSVATTSLQRSAGFGGLGNLSSSGLTSTTLGSSISNLGQVLGIGSTDDTTDSEMKPKAVVAVNKDGTDDSTKSKSAESSDKNKGDNKTGKKPKKGKSDK